jgi:hypothetical protein
MVTMLLRFISVLFYAMRYVLLNTYQFMCHIIAHVIRLIILCTDICIIYHFMFLDILVTPSVSVYKSWAYT